MSSWTHIVSNLYVDTFKESKNIEEFVRRIISRAPCITGSEGDVDIFVNQLNGYNTFISIDPCDTCRMNFDQICEFNCEREEEEYQTCVSISIVGDLRDRDIETTEKEFLAFAEYIKQNFYILYGICAIYDDCGNKKNINLSIK